MSPELLVAVIVEVTSFILSLPDETLRFTSLDVSPVTSTVPELLLTFTTTFLGTLNSIRAVSLGLTEIDITGLSTLTCSSDPLCSWSKPARIVTPGRQV